jgi:S-adenosylmethionine:tRNA ribosyltransferase-isomerase
MSEIEQYDYALPRALIADRPLPQRVDARLLVVDRVRQELAHRHIRDLPEILRAGDCLVINDTRVVPARILGRRQTTGGRWEGLFLSTTPEGHWKLLCKSRGKLSAGEVILLDDQQRAERYRLFLLEKQPGGVWLAHCETDRDAWSVLDEIGHVPLPHYIRGGREMELDRERYQTVYARHAGSVAAPTAGLHLSQELLDRLAAGGVEVCRVTLHVGMDTFRPIAAPQLSEHAMHTEQGGLAADEAKRIQACRAKGGRVVAVGTTSVRVLETAAADGQIKAWSGSTNLFIRPPYQFKAVDALLTNFHLPRTTLLVLVRTFGGADLVMRAYDEAIRNQYRFYSYGDAMLIL